MPTRALPLDPPACRQHGDDAGNPGEQAVTTPSKTHPSPGPGPGSPAVLLRRARLVALAVGAFLLPWCALLGATLPATTRVEHWALAWVGLDAAEGVAALATAVLLARADIRAALTATAGGALLLADAWFDVCTSAPGLDHALAAAEAIFVELPLAGAAFWLAVTLTGSRRQGAG
jgi:hypothetical protein